MEKYLYAIFETIDKRTNKYIDRLKQFVSIQSISLESSHRLDVVKALRWYAFHLKKLGADVRMKQLGKEDIYTGETLPLVKLTELELPDILIANIGYDKNKRTLLIYGHVDVKPIYSTEQWSHNPFDVKIQNGYLYGRGVTDDKGPLLAWLNVIEAFQKTKINIPVNIKFIVEGMEEAGSEGLHQVLNELKLDFFKNIDFVAISDNYWLGETTPCLTYGLRGVIYFYVTLEGGQRSLHSGCHGGILYEPLMELIHLLSSLTDKKNTLLIPGIYDDILPVESEELERFKNMNFDPKRYNKDIKTRGLQTDDKVEILKRRWCLPSISVHGIEHTFDQPGAPTLVGTKAMGKFSIRIVPNQNSEKVAKKVESYLHELHKLSGSPNLLTIKMFQQSLPFIGDHKCPNYKAAYNAIKRVWNVPPDLTRDGASIPVAIALEEATNCDVVLIPMGQSLDSQHQPNERLSVKNYVNGMKVFGTYFFNLATAELEDSDNEAKRQWARKERLKKII